MCVNWLCQHECLFARIGDGGDGGGGGYLIKTSSFHKGPHCRKRLVRHIRVVFVPLDRLPSYHREVVIKLV